MKKLFFTTIMFLLFVMVITIITLSTIGFETDKFNENISNKVKESNKNISLKLEKIKFKFDVKDFNLFLKTTNPELIYKDLLIPIQNVKVYLDFYSLIKSNPKIEKINISSEEINIDEFKKIILKTKPSNLNSLITNKIKNGKLVINLELYFNDNFDIDNFIARGEVQEMSGVINNDLSLVNTSFNFFADSSDILIKNIKGDMDGLLIRKGNLQIKRNEEITLNSDFDTEIKINNENIYNYLPYIKNIEFINKETNLKANLQNFLNITFDKTFKVTDYTYTNKGKIDKSFLKFDKPFKNSLLEKDLNHLYFKDTNFTARFASDKKNYIHTSGSYSFDDRNYRNYNFKNDFFKENSNINLDFEFAEKLNFNFINYIKENDKVAKIFLNIQKKQNLINLKELSYNENKNQISIEKLIIDKKDLISLKKIKVKTFEKK